MKNFKILTVLAVMALLGATTMLQSCKHVNDSQTSTTTSTESNSMTDSETITDSTATPTIKK